MICLNESMGIGLEDRDNCITESVKKIVSGSRIVHDCLVYDKENEIDENKINFNKLFKMYGDKTGYEVSCNEIRIEKELISKSHFFFLINELDRELEEKFSRKVVIYIQELEDSFDLRFHSLRENEKKWLSENLDEYDNPIICHIP